MNENQIASIIKTNQSSSKLGIIDNTSFSVETKVFLKKLASGESALPNFNFDTFNNLVTNSNINSKEKELVLTLSAIQYSVINTAFNSNSTISGRNDNPGCSYSQGDGPETHVPPAGCGAALGIALGALAAPFCGFPGAAGGFVVGFVIGFFGTK